MHDLRNGKTHSRQVCAMFRGALGHPGFAVDVSRQRTRQLIEKQGKSLVQLDVCWPWR
jgi:hypothetical protein